MHRILNIRSIMNVLVDLKTFITLWSSMRNYIEKVVVSIYSSVVVEKHLFIIISAWHVRPVEDLLLLVKLWQALLCLEMLVEGDQLISYFLDHLNLLQEHLIQVSHIFFNIRARFVNLIQQDHFLLNKIYNIIDVSSVTINKFFFLFQNLIY